MKKYTLYIGLLDKDSKKQLVSIKKAKNLIGSAFSNNGIEGSTFIGAEGIYTYKDGSKAIEKSFKIELLFTTYQQVTGAVKEIKQVLNQESVAVVTEDIQDSVLL